MSCVARVCFFFFNDTATTEIYTLSLHDALPICLKWIWESSPPSSYVTLGRTRSEEHTSELQSRQYLVCRLLLEKKETEGVTPRLKQRSELTCPMTTPRCFV